MTRTRPGDWLAAIAAAHRLGMKPRVARLLAGHPGRLARFGTGVTGHMLSGFGVTVACTGQAEDETWEQELVRDMLAIMASFAGRLYGQRSAKARRLCAVVAGEAGGDAV